LYCEACYPHSLDLHI